MIPLSLFLLACAGVYLGAIETAFAALMRLSLRLTAERSGRPGPLGAFLDDPLMLFVSVRLLRGLTTAAATALLVAAVGGQIAQRATLVLLLVAVFIVVFQMLLPLLLVSRDPERALDLLLPSFRPIAHLLEPVVRWSERRTQLPRRNGSADSDDESATATAAPGLLPASNDPEGHEQEEVRLLQSVVDFGDTLVREVMTPRPDIVAINDTATIADLRVLFREQEYSRFPVFKDSLDNILGFVFVKDVVLREAADDSRSVKTLLRAAAVVPESKRVPELLKQFQRQQTQCAIVVDEYGGTAGLVTIEDLLEEIVGEIRDEYDVESEPIVEEGNGRFVFSGKVDVDEVAERMEVHIEREGFETVGGYLLSHLGRVPLVGEKFDIDDLSVEVLDVERRRITKIRIAKQLSVNSDEVRQGTA
jgi:CBS domain containing-hemolysin-like protein